MARMDIAAALTQEREIAETLSVLKHDIKAAINDAGTMPGVTATGHPSCVTVKISAVTGSKGMNLSPETYIPAAQAAAVERRLKGCKSIHETLSLVSTMVYFGCVTFKNGTVTLNPQTINVLKDFTNYL